MKLYFLPSSSQRRKRGGVRQPHRLFTASGEEIKGVECVEATSHALEPVTLHADGTVKYEHSRLIDLRISLRDVRVEVVTKRPRKKDRT